MASNRQPAVLQIEPAQARSDLNELMELAELLGGVGSIQAASRPTSTKLGCTPLVGGRARRVGGCKAPTQYRLCMELFSGTAGPTVPLRSSKRSS